MHCRLTEKERRSEKKKKYTWEEGVQKGNRKEKRKAHCIKIEAWGVGFFFFKKKKVFE